MSEHKTWEEKVWAKYENANRKRKAHFAELVRVKDSHRSLAKYVQRLHGEINELQILQETRQTAIHSAHGNAAAWKYEARAAYEIAHQAILDAAKQTAGGDEKLEALALEMRSRADRIK